MKPFLPAAENSTGLVLFPAFDWCISPSHPEREERLLYTKDQLIEEGLEDIPGIEFYNPELATDLDIERVHFCVPSSHQLLTHSHYISAGGTIRAARAVMEKEVERSFAVVRPPGHHAMQTVFGDRGFCIINIESIMVEYIRRHYGIRKIAIVDTDCHHGDGTQDIFYNDPDTLFISIHQDGRTLYPGTGHVTENGGPLAIGQTVNIPLPPGTSEKGFDMVMDRVVMPILDDFQPELIINSAGQDNHYTDPITNMNFTAQGYARLTRQLKPDICVLEGGYSIEGALPYVNLGIILSLAGMDTSNVLEPGYDPADFRQNHRINNAVELSCNEALELYRNRHQLSQQFKDRESVVERKQVFYDTTGFQVNQSRVYHLCNKCAGYTQLLAEGLDRHLHGFSIPFNACASCQERARDAFAKSKKEQGTILVLQDRVRDLVDKK